MFFSRDEIQDLGANQLTENQLVDAGSALNGFASLFGKDWILRYFQGAKVPGFIFRLTTAWQDWSLVKRLTGAVDILDKWKAGFTTHGVLLEVRVAAALLRIKAEVELFPPVGARVADFRFRVPGVYLDWIYVEVSQRGISDVLERAHEILQRVAIAAASAVPHKHGKVALLRYLTDEEIEELITWLARLPHGDKQQFKDCALFIADPIETPMDSEPNIFDEISQPKFYATHFGTSTGVFRKGTAGIQVTDDAAERILRSEAEQLPQSGPGIIILDLSSVPGGLKNWEPLIARRLQPRLNRRINAVILAMDIRGPKGTGPSTRIIRHPAPRATLPDEILACIETEIAK